MLRVRALAFRASLNKSGPYLGAFVLPPNV